jgi:predicted MFS family arabinose efflux permease
VVLAIAGAAAVANLYYNQPLLSQMANDLGVSTQAIGLVTTLTQLGYALGIFLFVPLGDIRDKKGLILALLGLVVIALVATAFACNLPWLYLAALATGLFAVVPQVITPLAAQLASDQQRGQVLGTVVGGLLLGILLARTVAGFIGQWLGWRSMFLVAAGVMVVVGLALSASLPRVKASPKLPYRELLFSVVAVAWRFATLRWVAASGALLFGAFSAFWTTLTFFLSGSSYHLQAAQVGLFGLFGAAGALAAPLIGRWGDRARRTTLIKITIVISLAGYLILAFCSGRLWGIALGTILLDMGIQGSQVSNQTLIYGLDPEARSRINSVFVVSNFVGAALGSFLGTLAWNSFGWIGPCMVGILMLVSALGVHLAFIPKHVARELPTAGP